MSVHFFVVYTKLRPASPSGGEHRVSFFFCTNAVLRPAPSLRIQFGSHVPELRLTTTGWMWVNCWRTEKGRLLRAFTHTGEGPERFRPARAVRAKADPLGGITRPPLARNRCSGALVQVALSRRSEPR